MTAPRCGVKALVADVILLIDIVLSRKTYRNIAPGTALLFAKVPVITFLSSMSNENGRLYLTRGQMGRFFFANFASFAVKKME